MQVEEKYQGKKWQFPIPQGSTAAGGNAGSTAAGGNECMSRNQNCTCRKLSACSLHHHEEDTCETSGRYLLNQILISSEM